MAESLLVATGTASAEWPFHGAVGRRRIGWDPRPPAPQCGAPAPGSFPIYPERASAGMWLRGTSPGARPWTAGAAVHLPSSSGVPPSQRCPPFPALPEAPPYLLSHPSWEGQQHCPAQSIQLPGRTREGGGRYRTPVGQVPAASFPRSLSSGIDLPPPARGASERPPSLCAVYASVLWEESVPQTHKHKFEGLTFLHGLKSKRFFFTI